MLLKSRISIDLKNNAKIVTALFASIQRNSAMSKRTFPKINPPLSDVNNPSDNKLDAAATKFENRRNESKPLRHDIDTPLRGQNLQDTRAEQQCTAIYTSVGATLGSK